jgi:hypothetical protein
MNEHVHDDLVAVGPLPAAGGRRCAHMHARRLAIAMLNGVAHSKIPASSAMLKMGDERWAQYSTLTFTLRSIHPHLVACTVQVTPQVHWIS